jgi:hypothetical protein
VADIWQEMMGLDKISMVDNFFQLGGRSLVAVKIMAKLEEKPANVCRWQPCSSTLP